MERVSSELKEGVRVMRINCRTKKRQEGIVNSKCSYGIDLWNVKWDGARGVQCCYGHKLKIIDQAATAGE